MDIDLSVVAKNKRRNLMCRGCLSTIKLRPLTKKLADVFRDITNLPVSPDDIYPKHICNICVHYMKKFMHFRQKCASAKLAYMTNCHNNTYLERTNFAPVLQETDMEVLTYIPEKQLVPTKTINVDYVPAGVVLMADNERAQLYKYALNKNPKKKNSLSLYAIHNEHNYCINLDKNQKQDSSGSDTETASLCGSERIIDDLDDVIESNNYKRKMNEKLTQTEDYLTSQRMVTGVNDVIEPNYKNKRFNVKLNQTGSKVMVVDVNDVIKLKKQSLENKRYKNKRLNEKLKQIEDGLGSKRMLDDVNEVIKPKSKRLNEKIKQTGIGPKYNFKNKCIKKKTEIAGVEDLNNTHYNYTVQNRKYKEVDGITGVKEDSFLKVHKTTNENSIIEFENVLVKRVRRKNRSVLLRRKNRANKPQIIKPQPVTKNKPNEQSISMKLQIQQNKAEAENYTENQTDLKNKTESSDVEYKLLTYIIENERKESSNTKSIVHLPNSQTRKRKKSSESPEIRRQSFTNTRLGNDDIVYIHGNFDINTVKTESNFDENIVENKTEIKNEVNVKDENESVDPDGITLKASPTIDLNHLPIIGTYAEFETREADDIDLCVPSFHIVKHMKEELEE